MSKRAGLDDCLDHTRIGPFQILIYVLCALMAGVDGFDTQVIGMVAPALASAWHLSPAAFSGVFSLGLIGAFVGMLALGGASDRFGRKPVLLASILLFASASLLTPFAHTILELEIIRLAAGLGLGGALPGLAATTADYAPKAMRARVTGLMYCSFPLGSVLAGVVAAQMIPVWGWGSVFYVGGLFPLALIPVFAFVVPESARFIAGKEGSDGVVKLLRRLGSDLDWDGVIENVAGPARSSVRGLFIDGLALGTALLWSALFLSLVLAVFVVSWLPLLARTAGIDMRSAVLTVSAWNIGGVLGCYLIGLLSARLGLTKTIALSYGIGGAAVVGLGFGGASGSVLLAAAFVSGIFVIGAQMSLIGFASSVYDTSRRATGMGWALGAGKLGAVVGPMIGGLLIARGAPMPVLFSVAGLASFAAAVAVFGLGAALRRIAPASEIPTNPAGALAPALETV